LRKPAPIYPRDLTVADSRLIDDMARAIHSKCGESRCDPIGSHIYEARAAAEVVAARPREAITDQGALVALEYVRALLSELESAGGGE
jgi:hypothetical protein